MEVFLEIFTQVTFVFFIVSSCIFGFSQALTIFIQNTIMSIDKESSKHYGKLSQAESEECSQVINDCLLDYKVFSAEAKKYKKITESNRIRKFFKIKLKDVSEPEISFKDILLNLANNLSKCFINSESDSNTMFLSFSEKEIFELSLSLINRIDEILSVKNLKILKRIKISNLLVFLDYYGKFSKIKNNLFFVIVFDIINIAMFVSRFLSPIGALKSLIKNISNDEFQDILSKTIINVLGKELSVVYKERALIRDNNENNIN